MIYYVQQFHLSICTTENISLIMSSEFFKNDFFEVDDVKFHFLPVSSHVSICHVIVNITWHHNAAKCCRPTNYLYLQSQR